jgi:hypothetical protein
VCRVLSVEKLARTGTSFNKNLAGQLHAESARNYAPEQMLNERGIPPWFAVEGSLPVFAISCSEIRSMINEKRQVEISGRRAALKGPVPDAGQSFVSLIIPRSLQSQLVSPG